MIDGRVKFARLFTRLDEGLWFRPCIIGHASRPWIKDQTGVTHLQHHIYINLWIAELEFEWVQHLTPE